MLTLDEQMKIAKREAQRYSHLPGADIDGAVQEAALAILQATKTATQNGNVENLIGYVTRAAQHAAHWHVWQSASPLKHTDRGLVAQQVYDITREDETVLDLQPDTDEDPERYLVSSRWRTEVQIRLAELLANDPEVDQQIAWRTLICEDTPESVATEEAVAVNAVYIVNKRVRQRILNDPEMQRLLSQILRR